MNHLNDHGHGFGLNNAFSELEFLSGPAHIGIDQNAIPYFDSFVKRERIDSEEFETSSNDLLTFGKINNRRKKIDKKASKRKQTRKLKRKGNKLASNFISLEVGS